MDHISQWSTIETIANKLSEASIAYQLAEETALFVQGINELELKEVIIHIQWDSLEAAYDLFSEHSPSKIDRNLKNASFSFIHQDHIVKIYCYFNTTIRTDPYRISITKGNTTMWCRSLYGYLYDQNSDLKIKQAAHTFLLKKTTRSDSQ